MESASESQIRKWIMTENRDQVQANLNLSKHDQIECSRHQFSARTEINDRRKAKVFHGER
jgi:hypothetical protein